MEERNKLWRRKQQYRLLKSRIVKRADGFRGFMLDDGTYVQHPHWTVNKEPLGASVQDHWHTVQLPIVPGRELFTPRLRARNQTNYRRFGNVKKLFGEKSQRLSRVRVAPQYGFLCVMDL